MEHFLSAVSEAGESMFSNEAERVRALDEARALVHRLETPYERMYKQVWIEPITTVCMKTAADLKLFGYLSEVPQPSTKLAEQVSADPALLRRILRVLVKDNVITEADNDTYMHTEYSKVLADPDGLVRGIDVFYESSIRQQMKLPEYFKVHGYQNPCDPARPPFKWIEGSPDFKGDRWDFLKLDSKRYHHFNQFLSALRHNSVLWPKLYSPSRILDGWDGRSPLLVDVGGGYGRDITAFAEALKEESVNARLVLQDRTEVTDAVRAQGSIPKNVEVVTHNFFDPNPIQGAKAYFLHSVLHDWADVPAVEILKAIKTAMKPDYSRVLLHELVLPDRASDWPLSSAALDLNMMHNFSALERTESQWRSVIEDAGLTFIGCVPLQGPQSMVEAELRS